MQPSQLDVGGPMQQSTAQGPPSWHTQLLRFCSGVIAPGQGSLVSWNVSRKAAHVTQALQAPPLQLPEQHSSATEQGIGSLEHATVHAPFTQSPEQHSVAAAQVAPEAPQQLL
jgi:hypothetical protein